MNPYQFTLKTLVSQMGYTLGAHTAWSNPLRKTMGFLDGADFAARQQSLKVVKEIISAHPEFKREAATWIKRGIAGTKN